MLENTELKKKIGKLEEEKLELKQAVISLDQNGMAGMAQNVGDMNELYSLK